MAGAVRIQVPPQAAGSEPIVRSASPCAVAKVWPTPPNEVALGTDRADDTTEVDRVRIAPPIRDVIQVGLVLCGSLLVGLAIASRGGSLVHNRMLPWILGRTLGVACYLALFGTVTLGIWLRHPWRSRFRTPCPEALLRAHLALAAATVCLLAGHVTSLALDKFAGVGWMGSFVPWHAQYKPSATALGTLALYAIVLVAATAVLAGTLARRVWFPVHSVSAVIFCVCVAHGILAGSDSLALRWVYLVTGGVVVAVQITRWLACHSGDRSELDPA